MQSNIDYLSQAPVLETRNLGKQFGRSGFRLQNIDLQLRLGELTGVVGENGNGKTTLFRICVGEIIHTKGELCYPILGENRPNKIDWYKVKQQIAYIPQELPKWNGTIRENLLLEASLHGFRGKKNDEMVDYVLHRMELTSHVNKKWAELSGGYKLRFALAKALTWQPKLLVIDEPLANLDINAQNIILNDLKDIVLSRNFPVSILISSQHLHEIESVADKLLFLKEGSQVYYGNTADFGNERTENTFELEALISIQEFKTLMEDLPHSRVDYNGLVFIIHTPLHITEKDLLQHLLAKDLKINYFRNISQSIKKYFL
jgi:ABC-2 type transport system ATP-binding protein